MVARSLFWGSIVATLALPIFLTACAGQAAPAAAPAKQVDYPTKAVTASALSKAGSGLDMTMRTVTSVLEKEKLFPYALPVENPSTAPEGMSKLINDHKNDPYYIQVNSGVVLSNKAIGLSQYGPADATPIANLITDPYAIMVQYDAPYKTLADLMTALKDKPKETPMSGGVTDDRLALSVMLLTYGGDPKQIAYAGFNSGPEAATAVLEGSSKGYCGSAGDVMQLIEAKKLRVLAIASAERLKGMPDVPTFKEARLSMEWGNNRWITGGPGMPDYAVKYWRDTFAKMVKTPSWQDALTKYQWVPAFKADGVEKDLADMQSKVDKVAADLGMKQK